MKKPAKPTKPSAAPASRPTAKAPPAKASKKEAAPRAQQPSAEREQTEAFEQAARAFHGGDYNKALALYHKAAEGPGIDIKHNASSYARMCEHRISKAAGPELRTAEDHYNFAITLINQRSLPTAETHLRKALDLTSEGDHIHYALALCRGLQGDLDGAHKHLRTAIELQPRNRFAARTDPDFAEIGRRQPLHDLIYQ